MMLTEINKCRFAGMFLLGMSICFCEAQEPNKPDSAMGELKLDGQHIERLVVMRLSDGYSTTFKKPGEIIRLPAGEYRLHDVRLKGPYSRSRSAGNEQITIRVGQQEAVKVGAPLVPTLKVQRQGRVLQLSYELLGAGGEGYSNGDRSKPPTFAVYKGQREIASGKFEFG